MAINDPLTFQNWNNFGSLYSSWGFNSSNSFNPVDTNYPWVTWWPVYQNDKSTTTPKITPNNIDIKIPKDISTNKENSPTTWVWSTNINSLPNVPSSNIGITTWSMQNPDGSIKSSFVQPAPWIDISSYKQPDMAKNINAVANYLKTKKWFNDEEIKEILPKLLDWYEQPTISAPKKTTLWELMSKPFSWAAESIWNNVLQSDMKPAVKDTIMRWVDLLHSIWQTVEAWPNQIGKWAAQIYDTLTGWDSSVKEWVTNIWLGWIKSWLNTMYPWTTAILTWLWEDPQTRPLTDTLGVINSEVWEVISTNWYIQGFLKTLTPELQQDFKDTMWMISLMSLHQWYKNRWELNGISDFTKNNIQDLYNQAKTQGWNLTNFLKDFKDNLKNKFSSKDTTNPKTTQVSPNQTDILVNNTATTSIKPNETWVIKGIQNEINADTLWITKSDSTQFQKDHWITIWQSLDDHNITSWITNTDTIKNTTKDLYEKSSTEARKAATVIPEDYPSENMKEITKDVKNYVNDIQEKVPVENNKQIQDNYDKVHEIYNKIENWGTVSWTEKDFIKKFYADNVIQNYDSNTVAWQAVRRLYANIKVELENDAIANWVTNLWEINKRTQQLYDIYHMIWKQNPKWVYDILKQKLNNLITRSWNYIINIWKNKTPGLVEKSIPNQTISAEDKSAKNINDIRIWKSDRIWRWIIKPNTTSLTITPNSDIINTTNSSKTTPVTPKSKSKSTTKTFPKEAPKIVPKEAPKIVTNKPDITPPKSKTKPSPKPTTKVVNKDSYYDNPSKDFYWNDIIKPVNKWWKNKK